MLHGFHLGAEREVRCVGRIESEKVAVEWAVAGSNLGYESRIWPGQLAKSSVGVSGVEASKKSIDLPL